MTLPKKASLRAGMIWTSIVALFTLVAALFTLAGGGEFFVWSLWWLFWLSLPVSLLSAIFRLNPYAHFAVVAVLGLIQWVTIGFLAGLLYQRILDKGQYAAAAAELSRSAALVEKRKYTHRIMIGQILDVTGWLFLMSTIAYAYWLDSHHVLIESTRLIAFLLFAGIVTIFIGILERLKIRKQSKSLIHSAVLALDAVMIMTGFFYLSALA